MIFILLIVFLIGTYALVNNSLQPATKEINDCLDKNIVQVDKEYDIQVKMNWSKEQKCESSYKTTSSLVTCINNTFINYPSAKILITVPNPIKSSVNEIVNIHNEHCSTVVDTF